MPQPRRDDSAVRAAQRGEPHLQGHSVPARPRLPDGERVGLPITVGAHAVIALQHAIRKLGRTRVDLLRIEPVPRSDQVTVWVALTRSAIMPVMLATMRGLQTAQFGRIATL